MRGYQIVIILEALSKKQITEGHTRPLLMLIDRPEEQMTLFKEMMVRKMTVREAEQIARRIAFEKVRKKDHFMTPEVVDMEEKLAETLGTRVQIEPRERGGRIWIDYFSYEELLALSVAIRKAGEAKTHKGMFDTLREEDMETLQSVPDTPRYVEPVTEKELTHLGQSATKDEVEDILAHAAVQTSSEAIEEDLLPEDVQDNYSDTISLDDRSIEEVKAEEQNEDLYNLKNFSV